MSEHRNHEEWLRWVDDRQGQKVHISVDIAAALRAGAEAIETLRHVPINERRRAVVRAEVAAMGAEEARRKNAL
jgi:hypothetical protein